jgi:hypothetical protein
MFGKECTGTELHDAYDLPNHWRLARVDHGFSLLAPTTDDRYEPCGLLRHHIKSFVVAFSAVPAHDVETKYRLDRCVVDTEEAQRHLPIFYELPSGWKLLKNEAFFTLAPSNRIFSLAAGVLTDFVVQFARDMGGRAVLSVEREAEPNVRRSFAVPSRLPSPGASGSGDSQWRSR